MNKQDFNQHLLHDIGYVDTLPMSIRATAHYEVYNEEQILENSYCSVKNSEIKDVILARELEFPYKNKSSFELIVDDTFFLQSRGIKIQECHDFKITFTKNTQLLHKVEKFFIEINHSGSFVIDGLDTTAGLNIILVTESTDFIINKCTIKQAEGYAIIIHKSKAFQITQCLLENNLAAGIMLLGESKNGVIRDCLCIGSTGFFNCDAGIHLCATSATITVANIPEQCHEALSIDEKTERPYGIVIDNCALNGNRAQGIYLEGAINCLLRNNQINNNNKEGVCLDWGSCFNIFKNNTLKFNGERRNLSAEEVIADFISDYPLLSDGSSSMKLPGISLDNGSMNQILENEITNNYGGGIKFIRSSLLNRIDNNSILHNAQGRNEYMSYFHGISAIGLGAVNNEFNHEKAALLDFLPSQLNVFSSNSIRGHYLSIYNDKASTNNTSVNNNICFYERWINACFDTLRQWKVF